MEEATKQRLTSTDIWTRALYMVLFAITYAIARFILVFLVIFQFLTVLITRHANEPLLKLGTNLSSYVYQILQFQTFNSEEHPFPFSSWPDDEPSDNRWIGDEPDTEDTISERAPDPEPKPKPKPKSKKDTPQASTEDAAEDDGPKEED